MWVDDVSRETCSGSWSDVSRETEPDRQIGRMSSTDWDRRTDRGTTSSCQPDMVFPVADTPSNLPSFVAWPSFPFEGQLRTKRLDPPVAVEPPRDGEDPNTCTACLASDDAYIWVSERWRVRAMDRPTGLPMVLILESRSHLDLGDLTNLLAAELGVMTVRLERAVRSLDGVERVHVNRWGDGEAHLHLWFLARPTGQLQLRGSFLSLWDDILEPTPEPEWRERLAHVAAWLADFGGRALAEPPRIEWHAPSHFSDVVATETGFEDDPEQSQASEDLGATAGSADDDGQAAGPTGDAVPVNVSAENVSAENAASGNVVAANTTATSGAGPQNGSAQNGSAQNSGPHNVAAQNGVTQAGIGEIAGAQGASLKSAAVAAPAALSPAAPSANTSNSTAPPGVAAQRATTPNTMTSNEQLDGSGWILSDDDVASSDILSR